MSDPFSRTPLFFLSLLTFTNKSRHCILVSQPFQALVVFNIFIYYLYIPIYKHTLKSFLCLSLPITTTSPFFIIPFYFCWQLLVLLVLDIKNSFQYPFLYMYMFFWTNIKNISIETHRTENLGTKLVSFLFTYENFYPFLPSWIPQKIHTIFVLLSSECSAGLDKCYPPLISFFSFSENFIWHGGPNNSIVFCFSPLLIGFFFQLS